MTRTEQRDDVTRTEQRGDATPFLPQRRGREALREAAAGGFTADLGVVAEILANGGEPRASGALGTRPRAPAGA